MQGKFDPLTGIYYFFILDNKEESGIRMIELVKGAPQGDISRIRYAVAGPPLVLEGKDVSTLIQQKNPAINGTEFSLNPGTNTFAFSAMGKDASNNIIQLSMTGSLTEREKDELYLADIAEVMRQMALKEAVLLGATVDVQQYVRGDETGIYKEGVLQGRARKGTRTGLDYERMGGRPLASIIAGYLASSSPVLFKKASGESINIIFISLGSPGHYHMWNELSCETLGGDLRGLYGNSINSKILRINSEEELEESLRSFQKNVPDIVGISVQLGSLKFMDSFIKRFELIDFSMVNKPLLVLGNQIPTYYSHELIEKYRDAIIVRGEGEESLRGLVEFVRGNKQIDAIPNIIFVKENRIIETELKTPNLENLLYPPGTDTISEIVERGGNAMVQTSRGCPWGACSYCTRKSFRHGRKWSGFPIERVLANIMNLVDLGITEIEFCDDEFFGGRDQNHVDRLYNLADGINDIAKSRSVNLTFRIFTRADILCRDNDYEGNQRMRQLLERLKCIGLVKVFIGVESGCPSQIKRYSRGMTFKAIDTSLQLLKEMDIGIDIGFVMFDPELSVSEMMENIAYFRKNDLIHYNQWPFRPLALNKGSSLAEKLKDSGLVIGEDMNFMLYKYKFRDSLIDRIVSIIDSVSPPESPTHHLLYGLKALAKKYFDPNKRDAETRRAQQYVEEGGLVFLDLMEVLGKIISNATDAQIEQIKTQARKKLIEIAGRVASDIRKGVILDPKGFFRKQLSQLGFSFVIRIQAIDFLKAQRIEAGLHTWSGGKGHKDSSKEELIQFAKELIDRNFVASVDDLDVLRTVREARPEAVIGFFVNDLENARQAAGNGANILIGPSLAPAEVDDLRMEYPQVLLFAEVDHTQVPVIKALHAAIQSGVDGVVLKKFANFIEALNKEGYSLSRLRSDYPELLIIGAGGIFEDKVEEVLRMPENIIAAVGFNAQNVEAFKAQADSYKEKVKRVISSSAVVRGKDIKEAIINSRAHPIRAGDAKSNVSSPAQKPAKFIRLPSQEVVAIIPEKLEVEELKLMPYTGVFAEEILYVQTRPTAVTLSARNAKKELIGYIAGLSYRAKDVFREFELSKENRTEDTFYVFAAATREDYRRNRVSFALAVELYEELKRQGYRYVKYFLRAHPGRLLGMEQFLVNKFQGRVEEIIDTTEPEYGKAEPPAVAITVDLENLDFAVLDAQINWVEQNASSTIGEQDSVSSALALAEKIVGSLVNTRMSSSGIEERFTAGLKETLENFIGRDNLRLLSELDRVHNHKAIEQVINWVNARNNLKLLGNLQPVKIFHIEDYAKSLNREEALKDIMEGKLYVEFLAGGSATRMLKSLEAAGKAKINLMQAMNLGPKEVRHWNIKLGAVQAKRVELGISQEGIPGDRDIKLGQRHLQALHPAVMSLVSAQEQESIFNNLKILIHINDEIREDVEKDLVSMVRENRIGFKLENILLAHGGYGDQFIPQEGNLSLSAGKETHNHGAAMQELAWLKPYTIDSARRVQEITESAFDYLLNQGVEYGVFHRINDAALLYADLALDLEMFAFLKYLKEVNGANAINEFMKNPTGQKGGLGLNFKGKGNNPEQAILLEGHTTKGEGFTEEFNELTKKVQGEGFPGIPYNRLYMFYGLKALKDALISNQGLLLSIKYKNEKISPEIPVGEVTRLEGFLTMGVMRRNDPLIDKGIAYNPTGRRNDGETFNYYEQGKGALIHDFKQESQWDEAAKIAVFQDSHASSALESAEKIPGSLVNTRMSSSALSYRDHEYTRKIREFIKSQLEAMGKYLDMGMNSTAVAARIGQAEGFLSQIAQRLTSDTTKEMLYPEAVIRLQDADAGIPPAGTKTRIGFYPCAADPLHWDHLFIGLKAIGELGLDKVIYVIQGADVRKPRLAHNLPYRRELTKMLLAEFAPLYDFTENQSPDGETDIFRILKLNPQQPIDASYLVGGDHYNRWAKQEPKGGLILNDGTWIQALKAPQSSA